MFNSIENLNGGSELQMGGTALLGSRPAKRHISRAGCGPRFSKIFRWRAADPHAPLPVSVQLAGSFTDWQPVDMTRDAFTNTWQLVLHEIPGNRTHRYMLLVNGEPSNDRNCDGLAVPETFEEQHHQLMTARGPRVFLLFAQTK